MAGTPIRAQLGRYSALLGVAVAILLASVSVSPGFPSARSEFTVADGFVMLPPLSITFAANSTAEVNSLITTDRPYIAAGDSFDLVSGSPSRLALNVSQINTWASLLRSAYPTAKIFAHTAGIAHYATLARKAGPNISGIYYDYEPRYEPEFTTNFTQTLAEFENAIVIAHAHNLTSVGYPFGRPISVAKFVAYDWNHSTLGSTVDQLVIQSQRYCHESVSTVRSAVAKVLGQYAGAIDPKLPTFQVTIGNHSTFTPNGVNARQAYRCARVLAGDGLTTLYLWWGPGENANVVRFLKDIGRT